MRQSERVVDQLLPSGEIVRDGDWVLTTDELQQTVTSALAGTSVQYGQICGTYEWQHYRIRVLNVTYLGYPHPSYKKRVQLQRSFRDFYEENYRQRVKTLLIGVYTYGDVQLFCDFSVELYVQRCLNNSSAHVNIFDLQRALREGFARKTDFNGNQITIFDAAHADEFLRWKFDGVLQKPDIIRVFDDFFSTLKRDWYGIDCYNEMVAANYRNKFQPEWPGFYLEFQFEQYLQRRQLWDVVCYAQDKHRGGIDLDLYFPGNGCYGDLKSHSIGSGAILGNDKDTILQLLQDGPVYYIVCNHDTLMDRGCGGAVTRHWNQLQGKENLSSYANKMKHSVHLRSYYILMLTKDNVQYLRDFNQGHNSGASQLPRKQKIQIPIREIENFLIHQKMLFH